MHDRDRSARGAAGGSRAPSRSQSPHPLLLLQHAAGNRATSALLSRQEAVEEPLGPLSPEQVAKALRFYRQQPQRYTADIISQIQASVGVEETGVIDEATVQGVAQFQEADPTVDPALVVDGMAGPRTLPRMFARGLNEPGVGQTFGEEAQTGVIDRWHELSPHDRATELVRLVNSHLATAGVPAVSPNATDTGNNAGTFSFDAWTMDIGLGALSAERPTRDEAVDIVDTIFHEARHAEQWFRMAQLRAMQLRRGDGAAEDERLARAIANETGILLRICRLAVADPLVEGSMQALIAQGWYDSVYGPGSAHRERTLTELDAAATARNAARARNNANPTPANQAALDRARARFERAHAAYQELPEENDAWTTGPMVGPGVTHGAPPVPATPGDPVPVDDALPGAGSLEAALRRLVGA